MAGKPSSGLADVVVASTAVSDADFRAGRLSYRGFDIRQLAGLATFEEVAFLLQRGAPPGRAELAAYRADLAGGRVPGPAVAAVLPAVARAQPPLAALRTLVSVSAADDPDDGPLAAARLTGRQPVLVAAVVAARMAGPAPKAGPAQTAGPDADADTSPGLAAGLLLQLTGRPPAPRAARALDTCLVLQADHAMAASTFAARVCAATGAGLHAAVTAALAALSGPLHGAAAGQVMTMLAAALAAGADDGPGPVAAAERQITAALAAGGPLPGFGHRAYRAADPRAALARDVAAGLAGAADDTAYRAAARMEELAAAERGTHANADFWTAVAYHYLGLPPGLATPVLSVARMAGWTAHILEQHADNRMIRPGTQYTGETGLTWAGVASQSAGGQRHDER